MIQIFFKFILKKVFELGGSLLLLASFCFLLLKLLPGGPFDEEVSLNPLVKENMIQHWGLQESTISQLGHYLISLLKGDWGLSMASPDQTVLAIIYRGLSHTLSLSLVTLLFAVLGAFGIAFLAVFYRDKWVEVFIDQVLICLLSLPSLFLGPVLIYIFGFYFNLLPVAFLNSPSHYILPVASLGLRPLSLLARILKSSLLENLNADYVRTAQAKGVGNFKILSRHVLRNSMIPFLSYSGMLIAFLLSGSFLVEMLFAIPGLGSQFITSISDRDYTMVVGLALFYGILLIVMNALMDFGITMVDPRMREKA